MCVCSLEQRKDDGRVPCFFSHLFFFSTSALGWHPANASNASLSSSLTCPIHFLMQQWVVGHTPSFPYPVVRQAWVSATESLARRLADARALAEATPRASTSVRRSFMMYLLRWGAGGGGEGGEEHIGVEEGVSEGVRDDGSDMGTPQGLSTRGNAGQRFAMSRGSVSGRGGRARLMLALA